MRSGSAQYSLLSSGEGKKQDAESPFDFASPFSYDDNPEAGYNHHPNFNSAFTYREQHGRPRLSGDQQDGVTAQQAFWLVATTSILTFLSYVFFIFTIPVSYWLLVKRTGEFDRLVVFRLGRMIGVKGPGRFVTFPWMDRTKRIDVRAAAFSVPPQQFITVDGGVVEMGAEIQYGIVDAVTMISEVVDHKEMLRSLGKALLFKILVKKTVQQLERDKRPSEGEILEHINDQVRKWGINVHSVSLSETKVLRQPESGSNHEVGNILKGLGIKGELRSQQEATLQTVHGFENEQGSSAFTYTNSISVPSRNNVSVGVKLLQSLTCTGSTSQPQPPISSQSNSPPQKASWLQCLQAIVSSEFSADAGDCTHHGLFKLEITETGAAAAGGGETEVYFIDVSAEKISVRANSCKSERDPDVFVSISSADLGEVLEGSLAPLHAYLTGRITANGDVRKLVFFDKLAKNSRKQQGSMFASRLVLN